MQGYRFKNCASNTYAGFKEDLKEGVLLSGNQQAIEWQLNAAENGSCQIHAATNPTLVVDLAGGTKDNGCKVRMNESNTYEIQTSSLTIVYRSAPGRTRTVRLGFCPLCLSMNSEAFVLQVKTRCGCSPLFELCRSWLVLRCEIKMGFEWNSISSLNAVHFAMRFSVDGAPRLCTSFPFTSFCFCSEAIQKMSSFCLVPSLRRVFGVRAFAQGVPSTSKSGTVPCDHVVDLSFSLRKFSLTHIYVMSWCR